MNYIHNQFKNNINHFDYGTNKNFKRKWLTILNINIIRNIEFKISDETWQMCISINHHKSINNMNISLYIDHNH